MREDARDGTVERERQREREREAKGGRAVVRRIARVGGCKRERIRRRTSRTINGVSVE